MRALLLTLALFTTPSYAEGLPSIDTPPSGLTMDLRADVALIVAVEDYAFLPDVPGARTNALAWEAYLRARGVGTVKLLVDREVSREEVLRAAAAVGAERGSTGRAWLVFIGHGATSMRLPVFLLACPNSHGNCAIVSPNSTSIR